MHSFSALILAVVLSVAAAQSSELTINRPPCTTKAASTATNSNQQTCEENGGVTLAFAPIEHSEALFGIPAYSGTLSGKVWYGTDSNKTGCLPYDQSGDANIPWHGEAMGDSPVILLIDRGDCTFVQKVRNAENVSANAVIIVDNKDEPFLPVMADDGTGENLSIPAVFISKADGARLKTAMGTTPADAQSVMAELSWSLPAPDNHVEWSFWTSANDKQSVDFVNSFKPVFVELGEYAEMTPHYLVIDGKQFECDAPDQPCRKQCTHNGLYCAEDPEHDFEAGLDGDDIVSENLRQLCVWQEMKKLGQTHLTKWWDYVALFDTHCAGDNSTFHLDCSQRQQTAAGMTAAEISAVASCVSTSTQPDGTNTLLEAELLARREDGMYILPTIMINKRKYHGRLTCPHPIWMETCGVLSAICHAFQDPNLSAACQSEHCWKTVDDCGDCRESHADPMFNRGCCDKTPGKFVDPCGVCGGTGAFDDCPVPSCRQADDPNKGVCETPAEAAAAAQAAIDGKSSSSVGALVFAFVCLLTVLGGVTMWYIKRKERRMKTYVENIVANYMPLQDDGGANSRQMQPRSSQLYPVGSGDYVGAQPEKDTSHMLRGMTLSNNNQFEDASSTAV